MVVSSDAPVKGRHTGFAQKIKTPIYRVVNARDIVPRVPPVFLPPSCRLSSYMRYLTRTKKERSDTYEDVKLLANPNMVYRAIRRVAMVKEMASWSD